MPSRPEHISATWIAKRSVRITNVAGSAVNDGTNGVRIRATISKVRAAVGAQSICADCIAAVPSNAASAAYHQIGPNARATDSQSGPGAIAKTAASAPAAPTTIQIPTTSANDRSVAV